jgi:sarcosine oxidase delta subunit
VAGLVAEHEAESARHLRVTRETVLEEVQEAVALAREKGDTAGMISGLKLICQMCGYLAPERTKVEISVDGEALRAKFAAMSDSELLAIADGRAE